MTSLVCQKIDRLQKLSIADFCECYGFLQIEKMVFYHLLTVSLYPYSTLCLFSFSPNFEKYFAVDQMRASRAFFYELSATQIKDKNVKYFADSTPVNMMQANYIYKLFPNAKFINMIRDGRDVALSVSKEKWGPDDPQQALTWWANRIEKAHNALLKVRAKDQMQMRLEDLIVNNRKEEYLRLLSFLEIEDHDLTREYFEKQMLPEYMTKGEWQQQVKDPDLYNKKYESILKNLKAKGIEIAKYY